jgi:aminopeptidase-like protein
LGEHIPLKIHEVPTGTFASDWKVPPEWNVFDAFIEDADGSRVIDINQHNLHLVGYSIPVNKKMSLEELQPHLHSLPEQPDAIPYRTSYYEENWGFCLSHNHRKNLKKDTYRVVIESELKNGFLTYGELIIPGTSGKEVFISTYVCHPSMVNNELSGPVITTKIAEWLSTVPRRYTYRIVFVPETIGAILYMSKNLDQVKGKTIAGFNLSCLGDERCYSFVQSRYGNTLTDRIAAKQLRKRKLAGENTVTYSYLDRQSDERQYCSPGVDLPLVTLCRSRFGMYPEYHTSLDNFSLVTTKGIYGGFTYVKNCLEDVENSLLYTATNCGEPQLGRRGLYPQQGSRGSGAEPGSEVIMKNLNVRSVLDVLAYCDGTNAIEDLSDRLNITTHEVQKIVTILVDEGLIELS